MVSVACRDVGVDRDFKGTGETESFSTIMNSVATGKCFISIIGYNK